VDFIENIRINFIEALSGVRVAGIDGVGEEGEEVRDDRFGEGIGVGEEDLRTVGIVPSTFLGIGKNFVCVLEFLELRSGFFLGETRFYELVWVALKGEAAVGGADLLGRTILREIEHFVVASLRQRRRRRH